MKNAMSRREFFVTVLPSVAAVRKAGRVLHWAFYLFCCYLAFRLFAGAHWEDWRALGWLAVRFLVPAVVLMTLVVWIARSLERHGSPRLRAALRIAGRAFTAVSLMAFGALLHDLWLRKPAEAVVGVIVFAAMTVVRWFNERRPEDAAAIRDQKRPG